MVPYLKRQFNTPSGAKLVLETAESAGSESTTLDKWLEIELPSWWVAWGNSPWGVVEMSVCVSVEVLDELAFDFSYTALAEHLKEFFLSQYMTVGPPIGVWVMVMVLLKNRKPLGYPDEGYRKKLKVFGEDSIYTTIRQFIQL